MSGIEIDEASPVNRTKRVSTNEQEFQQYAKATYFILLVMGGGVLLGRLLARTGITFPTYFGALILAAVIRNILSLFKIEKSLDMDRIVSVGNICLSMFLGMALISLKLWQLQSLALPLIVILLSQC